MLQIELTTSLTTKICYMVFWIIVRCLLFLLYNCTDTLALELQILNQFVYSYTVMKNKIIIQVLVGYKLHEVSLQVPFHGTLCHL